MPATTDGPTRLSLILRVRDRDDRQAWSEFVEVYGPFLYAICRKAGLGPEDAADATQNVFVRVLRVIGEFDYRRDRGRFRGWLGTIARHEIAEAWERRQREKEAARGWAPQRSAPLVWEDGLWEEAFAAHVLRVALDRTRARTTKRAWVIFKLTWLVGCTADKVGRRLGVPVARVFETKCRVLRLFREEVLALADDASALVPLRAIASARRA